MKLAIISDTHDNLATLEKAVEWMNKNNVEEIIHCGDICSPETLKKLSSLFAGKIHIVLGNVDDDIFTRDDFKAINPNVLLYGRIGELEIDVLKIAFTHHPKTARELAVSGKYDLVFYGHTHKPWEEKIRTVSLRSPNLVSSPSNGKKIENCRLINPGNLSNMLYKATFAVYNVQDARYIEHSARYNTKTDELELKILEKL